MGLFDNPETEGTQEEMRDDPGWNGVPPVGDRPIKNRWKFLGLLLLVFAVKIVIWGIYRFITGNVPPFTDPVINYSMGTFMKPLLQLGPLVLLWWYVFKEHGSPFRFTRKNLTSSIILGLGMALVFFFVATGVYVAHNWIMGYGTDFHFVAGWDEVGWALIIAMMFSYMIGTGPAEELFSRGFLQDQAARVFPLWQAMTFSAVLFAIGHLPISILMHKMPFDEIMWYMAVLVVMGFFFSIIYQWSRNIVFPILIHGLWDWYLSLFAIKGAFSSAFTANPGAFFGMVDFINTIITLVILLPVFYLIYRVFWKRRSGEDPGVVGRLKDKNIVRWIRERDLGDYPARPVITTVTVVGIFCIAMLPFAAVIGTDVEEYQHDRPLDPIPSMDVYENLTIFMNGILNEGASESMELDDNGTLIVEVEGELHWEDEPVSQRLFTNEPDVFSLALVDSDGVEYKSEQRASSRGSGHITFLFSPGKTFSYNGTLSLVLTLVEAGDVSGRFGVRTQPDDSNAYTLDVRYMTWYYQEGNEGALNVRW